VGPAPHLSAKLTSCAVTAPSTSTASTPLKDWRDSTLKPLLDWDNDNRSRDCSGK